MRVEIEIEDIETRVEGTYERLDLFGDENIVIKSKYKDLSDLSKIFSPYSLSFTVPASTKNIRLLNYFFNTEVSRKQKTRSRYLRAKIYITGNLFKVGIISIEEGKFKKFRQSSYSLRFYTGLSNFKEKFGDTDLRDYLQDADYSIAYYQDYLFAHYLQGRKKDGTIPSLEPAESVLLDDEVIVPLVSTKRNIYYQDYVNPSTENNNIKYFPGTATNGLSINELRPAIPHFKIMEAISEVSGINLNIEIRNENFYKDFYVWLNGVNSVSEKTTPLSLIFATPFYAEAPFTWLWEATVLEDTINQQYFIRAFNLSPTNNQNLIIGINFSLQYYTDHTMSDTYVEMYDNDNNLIKREIINLEEGIIKTAFFYINPDLVSFGNHRDFYFKVVTSSYFTDVFLDKSVVADGVNFSGRIYNFVANFGKIEPDGLLFDTTYVDLFSLLPKISVSDFITSFIKTFNLVVLEDPNNPNSLTFINVYNQSNKEVLDLTESIDIEEHSIKPYETFKNLSFKHRDSKLHLNKKYSDFYLKGFGELKYEDDTTQSTNNSEYKIETQYTIPANYIMQGTSNVETFWASEDVVDYKPIYDELITFFYNYPQINIKENKTEQASFVLNSIQSNTPQIEITQYNRVSINHTFLLPASEQSLAFSTEVNQTTLEPYNETLYKNFYENYINNIYNNNGRLFTFKCFLKPYEITDLSFNKLIRIEDRLFNLEESSINIVTGESTLVLSNVKVPDNTNWEYEEIVVPNEPPTKPTNITATKI